MALKIRRKEEPIEVNQIVLCLYSNPGIGKSTLGFSAHEPILFDFDGGAYRAANRRDSVPITSWQDAANVKKEDVADYQTVVIDTAGRALDFLSADIIRRFPKKGYGSSLTLQGYGTLKAEFGDWLKMLKLFGKDIVLIAHSSEDKNGDDLIERLDVQGGSKQEIYKSADAMGRLSVINGQRTLNFSPTETAFGKNPGNLDALNVPDIATEPDFLGSVIDTIKERLNALTESQVSRQAAIADWLALFDEAQTADDFNDLVANVKKADAAIAPIIKGALHNRATKAGFVYGEKGYSNG